MFTSGLVLNDDLNWISYHGIYDFAYLLRIVTGEELPKSEKDFFKQLELFFPNYYDIKLIAKEAQEVGNGSLNRIADTIGVYTKY